MQFQNNYKEAEWSMSKTQGFILNNGFVYTVFFLKYLICTSKSKRPWEQLEAVEGKGWGWVGKNRDLWENMCSALECAKEVGVDAEFTVGKQCGLYEQSVICSKLKERVIRSQKTHLVKGQPRIIKTNPPTVQKRRRPI